MVGPKYKNQSKIMILFSFLIVEFKAAGQTKIFNNSKKKKERKEKKKKENL